MEFDRALTIMDNGARGLANMMAVVRGQGLKARDTIRRKGWRYHLIFNPVLGGVEDQAGNEVSLSVGSAIAEDWEFV